MTDGPQADPGWYPDAQGEMRYWDGQAWTEYTATNYQAPPETTVPVRPFQSPTATTGKPWTRRWQVWLAVAVVVVFGIGVVGNDTTADTQDDSTGQSADKAELTPAVEATTHSTEPTEDPVTLSFVTDQKDGDSWVASDGTEYRLGLINTPETNEKCGTEATAFTRTFLSNGFTVDAYTTDSHGRSVAEVFDEDGKSLNVELAKSGLGDDRYLEQFRHENPDLGHRLDSALASASEPACRKVVAPVPLVKKPPRKTSAPANNCMDGYSPCLPIVADLNCGDIGHPVTVTGSDPYRLDRDGDGTGCD